MFSVGRRTQNGGISFRLPYIKQKGEISCYIQFAHFRVFLIANKVPSSSSDFRSPAYSSFYIKGLSFAFAYLPFCISPAAGSRPSRHAWALLLGRVGWDVHFLIGTFNTESRNSQCRESDLFVTVAKILKECRACANT